MADKTKIVNVLKLEDIKEEQAEENAPNYPTVSDCTHSKKLTDEEALAIGVRSLSSVRSAITKKEKWAIKSMLSYVAHKEKLDEETMRSILVAHFNVEELDDISHQNYDRAICFLVDFQASKFLN